jgi:predicted MPP superfamily phosphohydrolase
MTKGKWILLAISVILFAMILWTVWQNLTVQTTFYTVIDPALPQAFNGFRIVQISDLHNTEFGKNNQALLDKIVEAKPDMIVVTGDLLDSYEPNLEVAIRFMKEAVKIAPCYFVTGNHETRLPMEYSQLQYRMKELGVIVLNDSFVTIERDGETICIAGLSDHSKLTTEYLREHLSTDRYTILLSHRPEHFKTYLEAGMNLVLTGHTHGGQVRIPLVGALFAPGQGIFPSYDYGRFEESSTTMIVSRGLGNSSLPFRFNCQPELVIIDLKQSESKPAS